MADKSMIKEFETNKIDPQKKHQEEEDDDTEKNDILNEIGLSGAMFDLNIIKDFQNEKQTDDVNL